MSLHLQVVMIIGAVLFLATTIYFIRNKGLDLYHSIMWFCGAIIILLMALFPGGMRVLTRMAGIELPSNLVFLILIAYLMITSLSLSAAVSRQHARIRRLVQQISLLENKLEKLEKQADKLQPTDADKCEEQVSL